VIRTLTAVGDAAPDRSTTVSVTSSWAAVVVVVVVLGLFAMAADDENVGGT
jgi:hypothetical protein